MTTMTVSEAQSNGILSSEEDGNSIQEMLHLLSIPGMRESIKGGMETPIECCPEEVDW
jgi:antitoxin YefM